jgi:hypothetical protein
MFKKKNTKSNIKKTSAKIVKKVQPIPVLKAKSEPVKITEPLKEKVFANVIEEFIQFLKSLEIGQSARFGKLGSFKKLA